MKVKDLMRTHVVTLSINDTLDVADDIMNMAHIRHLPVVGPGDRLVGLVTHRDLLKASLSSLLGFAANKEEDWLRTVKVRDVMVRETVTVQAEAGITEAVDRLVSGKFGCLPVVDEAGRLTGLLTETDCLRCFRNLIKMGTFSETLS